MIFEVKNVTKYFGNANCVLNNVSFGIEKSDTVAIVGANGCGKSTLVHILTGLYKPNKGFVLFNGNVVSGTSHMSEVSICLPNGDGLIPEMTVKDFMIFKSKLYNKSLEKDYLNLLGLDHILKNKIGNCSSGEKQRLNLACSLLENTDNFIFDEPTANLDISSYNIFMEIINDLKRKKKTILLVSHHIKEIKNMSKILIMSGGTIFKYTDMYENEDILESELKMLCRENKTIR